MAKHVIIYLPIIGEDRAEWAVADEAGRLDGAPSAGTLGEASRAVEGRRATLVVPGDDVLLADAVVPGGSAARAQQAIPFALEEQLADDVDTLHFALGAKAKGDTWPVAVLGREAMERIVEQCVEADLRPTEVVPEPLVLSLEGVAAKRGKGSAQAASDVATSPGETVWTALLDRDRAVVRLHAHRGFSTEADILPLMLDGARRDLPVGGTARLVVYLTDESLALDAPLDIDVESRHCDSPLELYASGLASTSRINLLQGDFSPKQRFDKAWKPWRWSAALAACLCVILFAGRWLDYRRLAAHEAELDTAITETFTTALPGTRLQRPRRQMQSALDAIGAGGGESFVSSASQIAASLATQPQTTVRSIGYRNGRFDLDITTDALPTLDALKSEIESRGSLGMSVQSANSEDNAIRGRVRIE